MNRTLDELAAAMYGAPAPSAALAPAAASVPTSAPAPTNRTTDQLASAMYAAAPTPADAAPAADAQPPAHSADVAALLAVPAEVAAAREAAIGDQLHEPAPIKPLVDLLDASIARETREAVASEAARIAVHDLGLDHAAVQDAVARIPNARAASPEQVAQARQHAQGLLRQEFGHRAGEALEAARQLVARDPRIGLMLERSRLGDDPATVLAIARSAMKRRLT